MSIKFKAIFAISTLFGLLNIASAGYDPHCINDPYSKFSSHCHCPCPGYPQQDFPRPSA